MRRALSRFLRRAGKVATRGGSPFFSYGEQMEPPISAEVIYITDITSRALGTRYAQHDDAFFIHKKKESNW